MALVGFAAGFALVLLVWQKGRRRLSPNTQTVLVSVAAGLFLGPTWVAAEKTIAPAWVTYITGKNLVWWEYASMAATFAVSLVIGQLLVRRHTATDSATEPPPEPE